MQCLFKCCCCFSFQNLRAKMYKSREDFLLDVNLIVENSRLYNGKERL